MPTGEQRENPQVARSRAAALSAAQEILQVEGWDAVTHVSVAQRSRVGRTTLYRHWPRIDQLLYDVLLRQVAIKHVVATGDTRRDLLAELTGLRSEIGKPGNARVMATIMERAVTEPAFAQIRSGLLRECSSLLIEVIRAAREAGDLSPDLEVDVGVAVLVGPLIFSQFFAGAPMSRANITKIVDAFLDRQKTSTK